MKDIEREILLSFWKVHILHHAEKEPVIGQWIIRELRHHGYEVSSGTLYPMLARMCERDWLQCKVDPLGRSCRSSLLCLASGFSSIRRRTSEFNHELDAACH